MNGIEGFFRNTHFSPRGRFVVSALLSLVLLTQIALPVSAQTTTSLTTNTEISTTIPDFPVLSLNPSPTTLPTPAVKRTPVATPTASGTEATGLSEEAEGFLDNLFLLLRKSFSSKEDYLRWFLWASGIFVVVMLVWYAARVIKSFRRDRGYQTSHNDDQPSVDERLLSELAPMEVALLRGSIDGYYEKVSYLTRQLLKSRNLLENMDLSMKEITIHLHTMGVDPAFLDCVESIFERCTAVCVHNERPNSKAHYKLREDLTTLIHMNPFSVTVNRKRDRKAEKPKEDLLNSPFPSDDDE